MGFRLAPMGPVLTVDQFSAAAMDRPLSPWATFTGAAADAALQTPGLGTSIREAQAPELAKTPVAGGRGGVMWRDKTAAEVAAEGDTLYENLDEYKASPNFRENIPFEKGMTASRAKVLAEQNDISQVRQFYSSKRPVTGFLGAVAGSALDPVNYIPIVGEVAGAAAVARVGRIAGRAVVGSTDAALNSALFQIALSGEKGRLGDDVSWAAIATNAAFAALAGAAIGGAVGGFSKFRHWSVDRPAPDVETPNLGAVAPEIVARETNLTMSGEATARSEPVRNVAVDDVVSRMETAAMRTKSAEVMNDALHGMVNDGEVRLGERSQAHIEDMKVATIRAAAQSLQEWFGASKVVDPTGRPLTVYHGSGKDFDKFDMAMVGSGRGGKGEKAFFFSDDPKTASLSAEITAPDWGGGVVYPVYLRVEKPFVSKLKTYNEKQFTKEIAKAKAAGHDGILFPELTYIGEKGTIAVFDQSQIRNKFEANRATNYSAPAPDPVPAGLAAAVAKIEASTKPRVTATTNPIIAKPKGGEPAALDPLLSKEGDWRGEILTTTVDGRPATVNAGKFVDNLNTRIASMKQLLDCINAT